MQTLLKEIDEAANDYNKTKDPYYKNKWYRLIEKWAANGPHHIRKWNVSSCRSNETDDGTYRVIR